MARHGEGRDAHGGAQGGQRGGHRERLPRRSQRRRRRVRSTEGARRARQEAQAREAGNMENLHNLQGRILRARAQEGGVRSHEGDVTGRQLAGRRVQELQPRPGRGRATQRRLRAPPPQGSTAIPRDLSADGFRRDAHEQLRGERLLELRHLDPAPDASRTRRARHVLHEDASRREPSSGGLR